MSFTPGITGSLHFLSILILSSSLYTLRNEKMRLFKPRGLVDTPREAFNFRLFWSVGVFGMSNLHDSQSLSYIFLG